MKRALLTATAAVAFAATPATAQLVGGEAGVTNDTDITTDIGETAAEARADVRSDVQADVESTADAASDWDTDTDVNAGVDTEAGVGGNYYENEQEASAGAELDTGAEVTTDARMPENRTAGTAASLAGDADADVNATGEGGPYTESREDASARYGNLNTMADGEISAKVDSLDTEGLNAYAVGQIKKATGGTAVEASSSLETEAETRY